MRNRLRLASPLVSFLVIVLACSPAKRPFTLEDAESLRLLFHPLLSPDGRWLTYNVGDTMWLAATEARKSGIPEPRAVAAGLTAVNNAGRPFAAWLPDSQGLLFEADTTTGALGTTTARSLMLARIGESIQVDPLLHDSVAGRVRPLHTASLGMLRGSRFGGPTWAPDGARLAFIGWPIIEDGLAPLQVHVFNLESSTLRQVTDEPSVKTGLHWSPDGDWLAYAGGGIDGANHWIKLLDPEKGGQASIEQFEGNGPFYDLLWSPVDDRLLARSRALGSFLLEVRDDALVRVADLPDKSFVGWTPDGDRLLFSARDGMSNSLELLDIATLETVRLTGPDTLFTSVAIAARGEQPVVSLVVETGELAPDLWISELDTQLGVFEKRRRVTAVNTWLDSVALPRSLVFRWVSGDDQVLEAQLFLPSQNTQMDPPLVVIPYGSFVNRFPGPLDLMTRGIAALAADEWAIVLPNTRGISSHDQTDGYGSIQLEDTHLLLDALAAASLVDTSKVALFGHSHGATMVYYYLTHSDRFHGGIAFNGAADWIFQANLSSMSGLPGGMGGSPEELPDVYLAASPYANATELTAPLLAIVGENDTQIPARNGRVMVDTLQALGRQAELLEFSDENHWVRDPDNRRIFWERVMNFLSALE